MENESYTGATQRLYLEPAQPPADYATPIAATSTAPRHADPYVLYAILGAGVVLFLILLVAHMPQPAPFAPASEPSYIDNSNTCVALVCAGWSR